ncbi:phosphate ABC transporter substrate-binding/OmpA family protein [bacterium]|nr:phosphate ABC transporter substrate-binding/OmpA family protein [bacterium]
MNKQLKVFVVALIIGTFGIVGYKFALPFIMDKFQASTSDAANTKGRLKILVDNWVGYFPLCSKHMKNRMRDIGYTWECTDDKADYAGRMEKLKDRDVQFAVATVDSYILNGKKEDFPGTIVTVLDESKGGDAIVARKSKIASLDALKKSKNYKIAFTPSSPSEHLLRSITDHFDIPQLRDKKGDWRVEANGASDAYKKLANGEVDVAVLWEPEVSKAISNPEYIKILGTEDTHNLIVDILLVERDFSKDKPEVVSVVLSNYFRTLKYYRNNPDALKKDLKNETSSSKKEVEAMLKGVSWFTLYDNASKWFGVNESGSFREVGLADTVESTVEILLNTNEFSSNPIPGGNSLVLINSFFVEKLFKKGLSNKFGGKGAQVTKDDFEFVPLASDRWGDLREVGTLKVRPISFQSGTANLDSLGEMELEKAVRNLKHYPHFRIVAKGHTGTNGDSKANETLSEARASTVKEYLIKALQVNPFRVHAEGLGGDKPLTRKQGQSYRAWKSALSRVELVLVDEVY